MSQPDHLSAIETLWSVVRRAHGDESREVRSAQEQLLDRYGGAARRYLLAALRNAEAADDVYQDFALKFVRGDFRGADPEKGRFRSFLKSVLFRMVADHYRKAKRSPTPQLPDERIEPVAAESPENQDESFIQSWRDELLDRAWTKLEQLELDGGAPHNTILRLRVKHPAAGSPELAEKLAIVLGRDVSSGNVRVMLHRAREVFGDLLLDEVIHSLNTSEREAVEQELIDLRLMEYCKPALTRRSAVGSGGR